MEVNNPMMDQLLVNAAAQPTAAPNAKAPKDADSPDFDSMVQQKRTTDAKNAPKDAKQSKADDAPKAKEAAGAEKPVDDEQYAIAAAMMFQAQPDARYTVVSDANAELLPEQTVETVAPAQAEAEIELPEMPEVQPETLAGPETEVRNAEVEAPREETVPTQREAKTDNVAAPKTETDDTMRPEEPDAPVQEAQQSAQSERKAPEAAHAERNAARVQRRDDAPTEETRTDDAQGAQAAPLFERVDAPVVKVAEVARPVPLEAENGVEQLADELGGVIVNSADANRVEVTLTPEHLGKLTVEISRGENGALSVVLHASTERAANLLERGAGNLQNLLASNAKNDVQVEVRPAEESQQQFLNPDGQNEQNRQQQQQQNGRRREQSSAQDFLQQLRLGLVDAEEDR